MSLCSINDLSVIPHLVKVCSSHSFVSCLIQCVGLCSSSFSLGNPLLCVRLSTVSYVLCVYVVHIRYGRPGVLLRGLCVPAERRDDEPVLPLRHLPQVAPPCPVMPQQVSERRRRRNFISRLISPCQTSTEKLFCDLKDQIEDDLSESVCCYLPLSSRIPTFLSVVAVGWAALLPQCVSSSITARWVCSSPSHPTSLTICVSTFWMVKLCSSVQASLGVSLWNV